MKKLVNLAIVLCVVMLFVSCDGMGNNLHDDKCVHTWDIEVNGGKIDLVSGTDSACNVIRTCSKCGKQEGKNVLPTKGLTYTASGTDVVVSCGSCTATDIVIPASIKDTDGTVKNVVGIGDFFYSKVKSVLIPSTVVALEDEAFSYCYYLTEVYIPNGVVLGDSCFKYCYNLQSVRLPSDMQAVPYESFYNCYALKNVTPASLALVNDDEQFTNCFMLGY